MEPLSSCCKGPPQRPTIVALVHAHSLTRLDISRPQLLRLNRRQRDSQPFLMAGLIFGGGALNACKKTWQSMALAIGTVHTNFLAYRFAVITRLRYKRQSSPSEPGSTASSPRINFQVRPHSSLPAQIPLPLKCYLVWPTLLNPHSKILAVSIILERSGELFSMGLRITA